MKDNRLHAALAYAGAIPFMACALLALIDSGDLGGPGNSTDIAAAYGVAIASFMAGVHWGTYLYRAEQTPVNLLLTSNVITISVWGAFVIAPAGVSLLVTAGAFLALLIIDYRLATAQLLSPTYLRTRRNVTTIVIVSLALLLVAQ